MAESKLVSMRLPEELWEWAGVYAAKRRSTKTAIVEAALREFREACEGGVPELEQASAVDGAGRASVAPDHHPVPPASARAPSLEKPHVASVREMRQMPRPAQSEWERTMLSRQQRLNKGRG